MSEYTPTTEHVRLAAHDMYANRVSGPAFDRWLSQMLSEAWLVGVQHGITCDGGPTCPPSANPYREEK